MIENRLVIKKVGLSVGHTHDFEHITFKITYRDDRWTEEVTDQTLYFCIGLNRENIDPSLQELRSKLYQRFIIYVRGSERISTQVEFLKDCFPAYYDNALAIRITCSYSDGSRITTPYQLPGYFLGQGDLILEAKEVIINQLATEGVSLPTNSNIFEVPRIEDVELPK